MKIDTMDFEQAVIYRSKSEIAGVKPYFVLPNREMADYFDACGGAPEANLINWAAQFLPEFGVFVDIGAHCGTWSNTLGLARSAFVESFEAQPWLAALTKAGFALNGLTAHCTNTAISNEIGPVTMRVPLAVNHSTLTASGFDSEGTSLRLETGGASIAPNNHVIDEQGFAEIELQATTLDMHWLEPDLIKIDVEGAERQVLEGARKTINAHRPTILLECWQDERGQDKEELFKFLSDSLDYRFVQIAGWPEMYLCEPK